MNRTMVSFRQPDEAIARAMRSSGSHEPRIGIVEQISPIRKLKSSAFTNWISNRCRYTFAEFTSLPALVA